MINLHQKSRHVVEVWYNDRLESRREFLGIGEGEAVRASKRLVCRALGVDPNTPEGEAMMELMVAEVYPPAAVPAIVENIYGETPCYPTRTPPHDTRRIAPATSARALTLRADGRSK